MKIKRSSHDEFVKAMMTHPQVAKDFFQAHLPSAILEKVDLATLKSESVSFIDEQLKAHESDLLYHVQLCNHQPALLYLLLEHQSSTDPLMPFRLQYYMMQGLKRYMAQNETKPLPLPLIFPIVLFNGRERYQGARDIFTLFGENEALARDVFLKPFALVDVSAIPEEDIRKHQWAGIMELSLCRARVRNFTEEMRQLGILFRGLQVELYEDIVKIVLNYELIKHSAHQSSPETYKEIMLSLLPPELESITMNIAQAFEAKGKAEGKVETLNGTRKAIELLEQGLTLAEVEQETGIDQTMLAFLQERVIH